MPLFFGHAVASCSLPRLLRQRQPSNASKRKIGGTMDLPADSVELIRQWAARTNSVREVWLFGSRAKGTSRQRR